MKRTEQINVKVTPDLKRALAKIAKENDWTIAHTANRLLEKSLGIIAVQTEDDNDDTKRK